MYALDNSSGVTVMPPVKSQQYQHDAPRWFTEGGNGIAPSYPGADWFNIVQAELLGVLSAAKITPEKNELNQLASAIKQIILNTTGELTSLREVFVGIPIPYPLSSVPAGYLAMNGQRFDTQRYPKLAQKYPSGQLPDLRGEFLRGWDNGRGVDAGRDLLSWQYGSLLVQEAHYQVNNVVSPSGNTAENLGLDKTDSSLTNRIKMTTAVADNREANWYAVPGTYATDAQIPYVGMARPRNITFNYICLAE